MGFQFYNFWPYNYTIFPSMDMHVDPVNTEYFDGLHTEIENIEDTLGLMPHGVYGTVAQRLVAIEDSIGENFEYIEEEIEDIWELHQDPPEIVEKYDIANQGMYSGARCGFLMYNNVYFGPGSGNRYIQSVEVDNFTWNHFEITGANAVSVGCATDGTYIFYPLSGDPCRIAKFNPSTGNITAYTMSAGKQCWGECCVIGAYLYISLMATPAQIARMTIADGTFTYYTMPTDANNGRGMDTDGTYIYMACETDPVKLVRFNPTDQSTLTLVITTLTTEPHHVIYAQETIWVVTVSNANQVVKVAKNHLSFQTFSFPTTAGRPGVKIWEHYVLLMEDGGAEGKSHSMVPHLGNLHSGNTMGSYSGSEFLVYAGNYLWGANDVDDYKLLRYRAINIPGE